MQRDDYEAERDTFGQGRRLPPSGGLQLSHDVMRARVGIDLSKSWADWVEEEEEAAVAPRATRGRRPVGEQRGERRWLPERPQA